MPINFEDTFKTLKEARQKFVLALSMEPAQRDGQIKLAFFTLYESARLANTMYVARKHYAMEDGGLLSWAKSEFQQITETIYLKYYRQGNYPKQDLEADFERWFERIRLHINRLHEGFKIEKSSTKARDWMDNNNKKSPMGMPGRSKKHNIL
ncbi:MAG: hypothetical protein KKC46_08570 [Proteobacteria bacterium]|nr:hypothetical protein [Pseudomonadota bacterium]